MFLCCRHDALAQIFVLVAGERVELETGFLPLQPPCRAGAVNKKGSKWEMLTRFLPFPKGTFYKYKTQTSNLTAARSA